MELGQHERAFELYDREVRPELTDDLLDISNAVSLLWRLEEAGVDVSDRWQELAVRSEAHIDDHLLTFGDVHYLLALAAAGRADEAQRFTESLSRYAARHDESEAAVAGDPGLALALAILARQRGDHAAASRELAAVRDNVWRIGGSHAQRDLFEKMLIDSALRAGEVGKARSLLDQRLIQRPRNAWGWQHLAQVMDQLGDEPAAAAARDTTEAIRALA